MKYSIFKSYKLSIKKIFRKIPFLPTSWGAARSAATGQQQAKLLPVVPITHRLPSMSDGFFQEQKFSNIPHLCAGSHCSGPYATLPAVLAAQCAGQSKEQSVNGLLDKPLPPQCMPSDNLLRPCWKCQIFIRQMCEDPALLEDEAEEKNRRFL